MHAKLFRLIICLFAYKCLGKSEPARKRTGSFLASNSTDHFSGNQDKEKKSEAKEKKKKKKDLFLACMSAF